MSYQIFLFIGDGRHSLTNLCLPLTLFFK